MGMEENQMWLLVGKLSQQCQIVGHLPSQGTSLLASSNSSSNVVDNVSNYISLALYSEPKTLGQRREIFWTGEPRGELGSLAGPDVAKIKGLQTSQLRNSHPLPLSVRRAGKAAPTQHPRPPAYRRKPRSFAGRAGLRCGHTRTGSEQRRFSVQREDGHSHRTKRVRPRSIRMRWTQLQQC
jgi:hypothetical protein